MVSSVVQAMELGAQRARQREEDAYQKARRPIENAFADQISQQTIDRNKQVIDTSAAKEAREAKTYDREEQAASDNDLYAAGALFNEAIARQIDANPGAKPSDIIKNAPPEVLRRVKLDTPEAQAHFAQIYDADPSQLRAHAQMYGGGGQKVKTSVAAKDKDGNEGFLQTFEDGTTHFVPGYVATAKESTNPYNVASTLGMYQDKATGQWYQIPGAASGAAQIAGAKAESGAVGKAAGEQTAQEPARQDARELLQQDINDIRGLIKEGAEKGAFTSTKRDLVGNVGAALATSVPGADIAQRALSPDNQRIRDEIKSAVPRIANKIMQANNMGVRMLDTEKEYERFIAQVNSGSASTEAQLAALDRLERAMIRETPKIRPTQPAATGGQSLAGKKLKYNPATGELE